MSLLPPPCCPLCSKPAIKTTATITYRRGRSCLPVLVTQWSCPGGCETGPDKDAPFVFADLATMKANEKLAAEQWRLTFHEEMPPHPKRKRRSP